MNVLGSGEEGPNRFIFDGKAGPVGIVVENHTVRSGSATRTGFASNTPGAFTRYSEASVARRWIWQPRLDGLSLAIGADNATYAS